MAAQRGRSMLLKVGDVAGSVFTTVSGIRSNSIRINNDIVDITSNDDAPWRQLLGDSGIRSATITGSGLFKDDGGMNTVEDLAFSGLLRKYDIVFGNGDSIRGSFQVASYEYTGETTNAQTFTITLESGDNLTLTRA